MREDRRFWTDGEFGYLLDHFHESSRMIAEELSRSERSVAKMKTRIRKGYEPSLSFWTDEDEAVLRAASPMTTAVQLMPLLPGRTWRQIASKRVALGLDVVNASQKRADSIGGRPLIAMTCRCCGLLLAADWFAWITSTRSWRSRCKKCASQALIAGRARKDPEALASFKARQKVSHDAARLRYDERLQKLSLPSAIRNGLEYTEADHAVMSDPDLTVFQKALRLGRTYRAMGVALRSRGYVSHKGLGDPERDVWIINNPNEVAA